ncbi:hypothetical protein E1269_20965 [Jiangella asiatica]|uniref:DUF7144 domain-containing protein n=1 Tax=Jiangella asiatica TaxID=2530372 RepID=A0A4R5CYT0_9ACTN|nr:hypothetical protein E1269_20965 [Jiangella asiatica]
MFAGTMMIMIGAFQALEGLVAILDDDFYVSVSDYAFDLDSTAWGWAHLIIGVLVAVAGFFLFAGSPVAAGVAVALAGLSAIANFLFVPYYPFWSLLIVAINVFVMWAIVRSGVFQRP